jgi:Organic radical activating enzymes
LILSDWLVALCGVLGATPVTKNGGKDLPSVARSIAQLLAELQSPRVVITGGEPFIHGDLPELVEALLAADKQVSIETSGAYWLDVSPLAWITLSPKEHVNPKYRVQELFWTRANEIKLVVSTGEELEFYHNFLEKNVNIPVFCPISIIFSRDGGNCSTP